MNENTFTSRLHLLSSVQQQLNRMEFDIVHNKPFVSGSDAEHMKQWKRRSAAKLLKTLNDAAKQFGLDPLPIVWDTPSVSVHDDWKTDAETVVEMMKGWRTRIRFAVFASGELPKGWEISDSNIPQNPIRNGMDLAGWLNTWLSWIVETREADCLLADASNNLADFQRELRNAGTAMRAWGIPRSSNVYESPNDVNDAKRLLELRIDELTNHFADGQSKIDSTKSATKVEQPKIRLPTNPDVAEVWNAVQAVESGPANVAEICRHIAERRGCNADSLRSMFNTWRRKNIG